MKYCVLLRGPEFPEAARLAPVLAGILKMPLYDAARRAREAWGVMGEGLDEASAKALAAGFESGGFPSVVLPAGLIEELPAPAPVAAMEIEPGGLGLLNKAGERTTVLWNRVRLLAAAGYKEVTVKKVKVSEGPSMAQKAASLGLMMTGIPLRIGPKKTEAEKVVETSELVFHLDLYARKPATRFRVDGQDFNYSCLGERMTYAAIDNFRSLVEMLASRAGPVALSRGSRVLLKKEAVNSMGYDSLANLDRESRWLLTLETLANP